MTLPQAMELFEHWQNAPPENEILAMLARIYTSWEPKNTKATPADAHQASLENRWKSGAMNAKQLFDAMGGNFQGANMPGIGSFPGAN